MKYCTHCGAEIMVETVMCMICGCRIKQPCLAVKDDTMETVVKVFLILGCVSLGWVLLPLAWCIPITVSIFRRLEGGEAFGAGLKVCALLFVSLIARICLLCLDDKPLNASYQ